jgi:hypothetical protein
MGTDSPPRPLVLFRAAALSSRGRLTTKEPCSGSARGSSRVPSLRYRSPRNDSRRDRAVGWAVPTILRASRGQRWAVPTLRAGGSSSEVVIPKRTREGSRDRAVRSSPRSRRALRVAPGSGGRCPPYGSEMPWLSSRSVLARDLGLVGTSRPRDPFSSLPLPRDDKGGLRPGGFPDPYHVEGTSSGSRQRRGMSGAILCRWMTNLAASPSPGGRE